MQKGVYKVYKHNGVVIVATEFYFKLIEALQGSKFVLVINCLF